MTNISWSFFKETATLLTFYTCHLLSWPDADRLPDISSGMLGLFGIGRELQLEAATVVTHKHGKRRRALIERKRKLGGLLWTESLTFPWLSSCQEQREVWLFGSAVVSEHDSSLILVSKFYLIKKIFHSSECSFSSVRHWATPT